MSGYSWLRLLTFTAVAAYCPLLTNYVWFNFALAFVFVHYLLALIYSRTQIKTVFVQPRTAVGMVVLMAIAGAYYQLHLPLLVLFAVHHIFSEVYLCYQNVFSAAHQQLTWLRRSSLLFSSVAYFAMLRSEACLHFNNVWLCTAFVVSAVLFLFQLWKARHVLGVRGIVDASLLETVTCLVVVISLFVPIKLLYVVTYHVTFWAVYPLIGMSKRGNARDAFIYGGLTAACFGAVLCISPLSSLPWRFNDAAFFDQFMFWSTWHIMTSIGLSRAQPRLLWQWFLPEPSAGTAAVAPNVVAGSVGRRLAKV